MTTQDRGAQIQAPSARPSVDLAKLIELLAGSITVSQDPSESPATKQRSLFLFKTDPATRKTRLRLCTSGVLLRLFSHPKFREVFKASEGGGFVQDFQSPPFGFMAKLGGELPEGSTARLPGHLNNLMRVIDTTWKVNVP